MSYSKKRGGNKKKAKRIPQYHSARGGIRL